MCVSVCVCLYVHYLSEFKLHTGKMGSYHTTSSKTAIGRWPSTTDSIDIGGQEAPRHKETPDSTMTQVFLWKLAKKNKRRKTFVLCEPKQIHTQSHMSTFTLYDVRIHIYVHGMLSLQVNVSESTSIPILFRFGCGSFQCHGVIVSS